MEDCEKEGGIGEVEGCASARIGNKGNAVEGGAQEEESQLEIMWDCVKTVEG